MTKEDVKFVIETTLGEALNSITPLLSVKNISLLNREFFKPKINRMRFKFDMENELLECYICRKYTGEIPSNWVLNKHYDKYNNTVYKYLFDEKTMEPYIDYFDFSSIGVIDINQEGK